MIFDKLKNINTEVARQCYDGHLHLSIEAKVLKLSEEAGEVASTLLAAKEYENKSKSSVKDVESLGAAEALIEETIDVLMVADDVLEKIKQEYNLSNEKMNDIIIKTFDKKFKKWKSKINSDSNGSMTMDLNLGFGQV